MSNHEPTVVFRQQYRRRLEVAMIAVLLACLFFQLSFRQAHVPVAPIKIKAKPDRSLDDTRIVWPRAPQKPAPPSRPAFPVPVDAPALPEEMPLDPIDESVPPDFSIPLPPEPAPEIYDYLVVEVRPEPVGGFAAIQKHLKFPDMARRMGWQGEVSVEAVIDVDGSIMDLRILESSGFKVLDEAAIAAVQKVRWHPAYQREKAVRVKTEVPLSFRLK